MSSSTKHTLKLTTAALFLAVSVILSFISIPLTNVIEIRFNQIAIASAGIVLGPVFGTIIGAAADILGYFVKPTGAFFPGFTISYALTGFLFGFLLRKNKSVRNVVIAQVIVTVFIGLGLNTLWLSILYGTPFKALFIMRLPKECIMLPINIVALSLLLKPLGILSRNLSPKGPDDGTLQISDSKTADASAPEK